MELQFKFQLICRKNVALINIGVGISEEMHKKLTTDGKHLTTDAKSSHGLWTNELIIASPACPMIICITRMLEICQIKFICQKYLYWEYYKHTAFS